MFCLFYEKIGTKRRCQYDGDTREVRCYLLSDCAPRTLPLAFCLLCVAVNGTHFFSRLPDARAAAQHTLLRGSRFHDTPHLTFLTRSTVGGVQDSSQANPAVEPVEDAA